CSRAGAAIGWDSLASVAAALRCARACGRKALKLSLKILRLSGFGWIGLLLLDVLETALQQFTPFGLSAPTHCPDIQQSDDDRRNSEDKAADPINQKQKAGQNGLEDGLAPNKEPESY